MAHLRRRTAASGCPGVRCDNAGMPDPATIPASLPKEGTGAPHHDGGPRSRRKGLESSPASRFGAAADLLERLDTRPLHLRIRRRPWWKLW